MLKNKRYVIVMIVCIVLLVGCGSSGPEKEIFTNARRLIREGERVNTNYREQYDLFQKALEEIELILREYPETGLARGLANGSKRINSYTINGLQERVAELENNLLDDVAQMYWTQLLALVAEADYMILNDYYQALSLYDEINEILGILEEEYSTTATWKGLVEGSAKVGEVSLTNFREFYKKEILVEKKLNRTVQLLERAWELEVSDPYIATGLYMLVLDQLQALNSTQTLLAHMIKSNKLKISGYTYLELIQGIEHNQLVWENIRYLEYLIGRALTIEVEDPLSAYLIYLSVFEVIEQMKIRYPTSSLVVKISSGNLRMQGFTIKELTEKIYHVSRLSDVQVISLFKEARLSSNIGVRADTWYVQRYDVEEFYFGELPYYVVTLTKAVLEYGEKLEYYDRNRIYLIRETSSGFEIMWRSEFYSGQLLVMNFADINNNGAKNINLLIAHSESDKVLKELIVLEWREGFFEKIFLDRVVQYFEDRYWEDGSRETHIYVYDLTNDGLNEIIVKTVNLGQNPGLEYAYYQYKDNYLVKINDLFLTDYSL